MSAPEAFGHDVFMLLPACPTGIAEELVRHVHRLDRTIGVGYGREDDAAILIVLTSDPDPGSAEATARRLVAEAARLTHHGEAGSRTVLVKSVEPRRLSPGRPHQVPRPAEQDPVRVEVGDGRVLRAIHEGPLGDWTVWLEGVSDTAWRGRDLQQLLAELSALRHGERDPWVGDVIRSLAARETPAGVRYPCPCCDCYTLEEPPSGTYAICAVCWWEDDGVQFSDPDYRGGANGPSLREARENYAQLGVSEERLKQYARQPLSFELP